MINLETMARKLFDRSNLNLRRAEQWAARAQECHRDSNAYLDCRDNATLLRRDSQALARMARYVALAERAKARRLLRRMDTALSEQVPASVWRWAGC